MRNRQMVVIENTEHDLLLKSAKNGDLGARNGAFPNKTGELRVYQVMCYVKHLSLQPLRLLLG